MIFLLKYMKYALPLMLVVGVYFYGHSKGMEQERLDNQSALLEAQKVSAVRLKDLQSQLLETESQLLDYTTKTRVEYKIKTKEVIRYVKENKGVGGVDLNKCVLTPTGLLNITNSYN
jgi:hypothetical protein